MPSRMGSALKPFRRTGHPFDAEWLALPSSICCRFFGLQAIDQIRQHPNRGEILGCVVVVADLDVKPLLAKCAQIHKPDRVQTYDCPESIIQADIILCYLNEQVGDDHFS